MKSTFCRHPASGEHNPFGSPDHAGETQPSLQSRVPSSSWNKKNRFQNSFDYKMKLFNSVKNWFGGFSVQMKYCAWDLLLCFLIPFLIYISDIPSHATLSCHWPKEKHMLQKCYPAFGPTLTLKLFLTLFLQSQILITSNISRSTVPAQVLLKPTYT